MNDDSLDHFKTDRATGERYAGDHLLVEFWGAERLMEPEYICAAMEDGARAAGATILHSHYHHFGDGMGVSGVTVLAESHITIHTWPEVGYAAIDVFMCGEAEPQKCVDLLRERFNPREISTDNYRRGTWAPAQRAQRVA
jgi:S-adenosylmethionine decarboxylase